MAFWSESATPASCKQVLFHFIHPSYSNIKYQVLQPNHFAFLPGRGTSSELLQMINALEEVAEHGLDIEITTENVSSAFDSPERSLQWTCWRQPL